MVSRRRRLSPDRIRFFSGRRSSRRQEGDMQTRYALTRAEYDRELDMTLAGSFPASDPPFWTFGVSSSIEPETSASGDHVCGRAADEGRLTPLPPVLARMES